MKLRNVLLTAIFLLGTETVFSQSFAWAKAMGGTDLETGNAIAVDPAGNVYTTGQFHATADFDPGAGTFNLTAAGQNDIFISKIDAAGNFVWAKRIGGTGSDYGNSIVLDAAGNIFTTGLFSGACDFDPGAGSFSLTTAGTADIFVSKLDAAGNFVWAKRMGGGSFDVGNSIVLDASGNVYTTGYFETTADFDPGAGTFTFTSSGLNDIFISKLDASGNFVWAKRMGGNSAEAGNSIALDASGNLISTGRFLSSCDFDPGAGSFSLTSAGSTDIYISKLDASGNFIWAKRMGGTNSEMGLSLVVDASGNIFTTGYFRDAADFDPGAGTFTLTSAGGDDIFISKLDAAGNFVWAKAMGGGSTDQGYSIALDATGNIFTTGYFDDIADFDPGVGTFTINSVTNSQDIFILKLNPSGNFVWAVTMGGQSTEIGRSIAIDASGNIYTTGQFINITDFDPGAGTFNLTWAGGSWPDIFVHKMPNFVAGILENSLLTDMTIFPNPSNGIFQLNTNNMRSEKGELEIYNMSGEKVYATSNIKQQMQIDLSGLSKGLYFIRVYDGTKNYNQKIVVQ